MWETGRPGRISDPGRSSIEEIRIIATILLVVYHVIGRSDSGLRLDYPHELRFLADLLANFRMPAFAVIAGFFFCLRPLTLPAFGKFLVGKARRLAVPGLIAAIIFASTANLLNLRFALPPAEFWRLLVFPYAHYWFLQAILVLFVVVGFVDALMRNRSEFLLLGTALALSFAGIVDTAFFSINRAVALAPCFALGMCIYRHGRSIERYARLLTAVAALLALLSLGSALVRHATDPFTPPPTGPLHIMILGMPLCLLMLLHLPHNPYARRLGQYSFTIYLYHVFATASMRTLLLHLGIVSIPVHVVLGTAAGVTLPIMLHLTLQRIPGLGAPMLGLRPPARNTPRTEDATPLIKEKSVNGA